MALKLEGAAELRAKLAELGSEKDMRATFRAGVREPMKDVLERARSNVARVSPGKRELHRTYRGRLVSAGFAARSLRQVTYLRKGVATSMVGVEAEAFYAVQFLELGTAKIAARPWLTPSFVAYRNVLPTKVGAVIRQRLAAIAARRSGANAS